MERSTPGLNWAREGSAAPFAAEGGAVSESRAVPEDPSWRRRRGHSLPAVSPRFAPINGFIMSTVGRRAGRRDQPSAGNRGNEYCPIGRATPVDRDVRSASGPQRAAQDRPDELAAVGRDGHRVGDGRNGRWIGAPFRSAKHWRVDPRVGDRRSPHRLRVRRLAVKASALKVESVPGVEKSCVQESGTGPDSNRTPQRGSAASGTACLTRPPRGGAVPGTNPHPGRPSATDSSARRTSSMIASRRPAALDSGHHGG